MAAHLLDEGVDDRAAPAGLLAADEHPVLVIEFCGTDGVFRQIVVELDLALHEAGWRPNHINGKFISTQKDAVQPISRRACGFVW